MARHDLRRRARVIFKVGDPPPTVVSRYAAAAGVVPQAPPWLGSGERGDALILCPGAAHASKQWPAGRFVELGRRWSGPVIVLGGPDERELVQFIAETLGSRAEGLAERGYARTLAALGRGRVAVAGDTGLLHLAAAAGLPVVGLFGPTTSQDGFWDAGSKPGGEAVELQLSCRPCSLHGGGVCPIGVPCLDTRPADLLAALAAAGLS